MGNLYFPCDRQEMAKNGDNGRKSKIIKENGKRAGVKSPALFYDNMAEGKGSPAGSNDAANTRE
ncbi:MAG: hypothetical protein IKH16_03405 [Selenomonadaceae bacterium]|nr:hypothetical protein [Selenomonadaceae bacterium]MBR4696099.1 hypothetical protein [Selenomonadaceae bacterium]